MVVAEDLRVQLSQRLEAEARRAAATMPDFPALDVTPAIPREYQTVVEEGLQLLYAHHYRVIFRLYPSAMVRISLDDLRSGPVGQDLARLAQIAAGVVTAPADEVRSAIDSILQLFFWPLGTASYSIPRDFWHHHLGQMLSLAKLRSFQAEELISVAEAAKRLGVTRRTIYRWLDDRSLDWVHDTGSGRVLVVRADVEAMHADMASGGMPGIEPIAEVRRRNHPYVSETPGVVGGYPAIRDTRMPVRAIVEVYRETNDTQSILEVYPHLSREQVLGALDYYRRFPARVDEDIATNTAAVLAYTRR